jgi:hypothetical protein
MSEQTPVEYNGVNELARERLRGHPADLVTLHIADQEVLRVQFQMGGTADNPRNGVFIEDLIIVAISKLESYQAKFPCRENALAITKLEESLQWLTSRKADREARGVYGKDIK